MAMLLIVLGLGACRSADDTDEASPRFPRTPDPDAFAAFLNPAPAVPLDGVPDGAIHNVEDFPEAYYNTIDPTGSRDTLTKWRIENGFLNADGSEADCDPARCRQTHVKFRDTKDLGYGRNMFLRWNTLTNDIAIYVENFQVDAVPGLPYGPLNFDALVAGERRWNFGVNAIEFSAWPDTAPGAPKFTKFYNFAGDGERAMLASGLQQHFVDLDNRGAKPMPQACIVCHGGRGRTLVYRDSDGRLKLAPTITGGIPGDVQAQLQSIELDTLAFSSEPGFTRADNAAGIRLINQAVLQSYREREAEFPRAGEWDPSLAIALASGRYGGVDTIADNAAYAEEPTHVPAGWQGGAPALYRALVGPNCTVCHALRGSRLNGSLTLPDLATLQDYGVRIEHLVFERGLMPLGLLNYANFWESDDKDPAALAEAIGATDRITANGRAIRPGSAVARIAAPPVATGIDSATGEQFDIPLSGRSSGFVGANDYAWTVEPADTANIVLGERPGEAVLRSRSTGVHTVTLSVSGASAAGSSTDSVNIDVRDASSVGAPPPTASQTFYGPDGIYRLMADKGCMGCHQDNGLYPGIPLHYCPSPGLTDYDFIYRSVLARVNFTSPLDSLFLRKPLNGATDYRLAGTTAIPGYHVGGNVLPFAEDIGRVLGWMLSGAPRGALPSASEDLGACQ